MPVPLWIEKLKQRWQLNSIAQVVIVLMVFGCTGVSVYLLKKPILSLLIGEGNESGMAKTLYYIFILPIYNILLLGYGFLFGQFKFFWAFEKRFFNHFIPKSKRK